MMPFIAGVLTVYHGRLAARLRTVEAQVPDDWRQCKGLSALLDWARKHPQPPRDWDEFDQADPETLGGLGRLLWAARRQRHEKGDV